MTAAIIVRIGRPKMVISAVAGMSISFMVFLLLKGLIRGQMKAMRCYIFFCDADENRLLSSYYVYIECITLFMIVPKNYKNSV